MRQARYWYELEMPGGGAMPCGEGASVTEAQANMDTLLLAAAAVGEYEPVLRVRVEDV